MVLELLIKSLDETNRMPGKRRENRIYGGIIFAATGASIVLDYLLFEKPHYLLDAFLSSLFIEGFCDIVTGKHHTLYFEGTLKSINYIKKRITKKQDS